MIINTAIEKMYNTFECSFTLPINESTSELPSVTIGQCPETLKEKSAIICFCMSSDNKFINVSYVYFLNNVPEMKLCHGTLHLYINKSKTSELENEAPNETWGGTSTTVMYVKEGNVPSEILSIFSAALTLLILLFLTFKVAKKKKFIENWKTISLKITHNDEEEIDNSDIYNIDYIYSTIDKIPRKVCILNKRNVVPVRPPQIVRLDLYGSLDTVVNTAEFAIYPDSFSNQNNEIFVSSDMSEHNELENCDLIQSRGRKIINLYVTIEAPNKGSKDAMN